MKSFLSLFIALFLAIGMSAQDNPMFRPLPGDPAVKVGKLENGLTYYIRHNELPAKRVELYLCTNVGAIQETPDQDGLAHFLEHMCFNGTEHFPGKGILNWLQSIGAEFGRNINASTGWEETQYMLNNIPLERETVLDTCLMVLRDYAHFVSNETKEIDAERPVIREERRQRRDGSWRATEASLPYFFGDTKYSTCTIIGSEENIMGFDPQSLHNFYSTWYHPDMQAVVVVGDIDVDRTEAKIAEIFGVIPKKENPAPKAVIPFPANKETVIGIITDPEIVVPSVEIAWKSEPAPEAINNTVAGQMQVYIKRLINFIMSERFNDLMSSANAPFISANFGIWDLIYETVEAADAVSNLKADNILGGIEALYTEIERMRRFGFNQDELDRAKASILSRLETAAEKADTRKNPQLVRPLISNFFDNTPFLDPKTDLELGKQILASLNTDILNQVASQLFPEENCVIVYKGPDKEGFMVPTKEQIAEVVAKVKASDIKALSGEEVASDFVDPATLAGCKVKKTAKGPYGSTLWTLKNGVKVYVLPTEYQKDQIVMNLYRDGGLSVIPAEDLPSFNSDVMLLYSTNRGIGEFSGSQAKKMLSGKTVQVSPFIEGLHNGISATSSKKDLETAFQLMYMNYVKPRFDEEEYMVGVGKLKSILPSVMSNPQLQMQKGLQKALYNDNPRHRFIDMQLLEEASMAAYARNYGKLFSDAAGLSLVIVGDVDVDAVKPLVEKYVGSIPAGKKAPKWVDNKDYVVDGIVEVTNPVTMETPTDFVALQYHAPLAYDPVNDAALTVASFILDMRYTKSLREEIGGTYGASVITSQDKDPVSVSDLLVLYQCKPELCDTMLTVTKATLAEFCTDGPTEEEFNMAILNAKKNIPEKRINNSYWLRQIRNVIEAYGDVDKAYEEAVNSLTADKVREVTAAVVNSGNKVEYVMIPAE